MEWNTVIEIQQNVPMYPWRCRSAWRRCRCSWRCTVGRTAPCPPVHHLIDLHLFVPKFNSVLRTNCAKRLAFQWRRDFCKRISERHTVRKKMTRPSWPQLQNVDNTRNTACPIRAAKNAHHPSSLTEIDDRLFALTIYVFYRVFSPEHSSSPIRMAVRRMFSVVMIFLARM